MNRSREYPSNECGTIVGIFFVAHGIDVPAISLDTIPNDAWRVHPQWGMKQILSTFVLDKMLKPKRPDDTVALLCLTTTDFWPGKGWNFVFGQASLSERVGVWSMARYGDPQKDEEAYQLALLRTLKVATHETGHMFGIQHCVWYHCGMNGSMSLPATDAGPLTFCSECAAKLWWAIGSSSEKWMNSLTEFAERQQLKAEAKFWNQCAA